MYRILLLVALLYAFVSPDAKAQQRDAWARVEAFDRKGLPRSAAAVVDSIYAEARESGNMPQLVKALMYRARYVSALEEEAADSVVADFKRAIEEATPPARALLHSMLGELYVRYYHEHRWQFHARSAVTSYDENDIRTWDIRKILQEATKHYLASLEPAETLQQTPIAAYEAVLEPGAQTRALRPTLYDFLAHRALDFFERGEAGILAPERALILQSDAYFAAATKFIALQTNDSPDGQALKILQDLLRFRLERDDVAAFLDADLRRLAFVHQHSVAPRKDSLYVTALEYLEREYAGNPAVTGVTLALAQWYVRQGRSNRKAFELCAEAIRKHPTSHGAQGCRALQAELRQAHVSLDMEAAVVPGKPALARIEYRNVERLHVRIVPVSVDEWRAFERGQHERRAERLRAFAQRNPAATFQVELPATEDMEQHSADLLVPALRDGSYLLLLSHDGTYTFEKAAFTFVQASPISYAVRPAEDVQEIYVLHRETGAPLQGAEVWLSYERAYNQQPERAGPYTTDENGLARVRLNRNEPARLSIEFAGSRLEGFDYLYTHGRMREEPGGRLTTFFTDRSLYRPGQTVYFKGIVLEHNGERYDIVPRARTRVRFLDANGQEVSALDLATNEYGSFSGTFTAPRGGLTGGMAIENESGRTFFSVEEYKRPRFEVTLERPEGTYALGDTVRVEGSAEAYAGATLDEAEVVYRITRGSHIRPMPYWRPNIMPRELVEIARGVVQTDREGRFTIAFPALPDLRVPREADPVFEYQIHVDVTDVTGETHSAQSHVRVGYTKWRLHVDVPERVDKSDTLTLTITSANLNGAPVPAEGGLRVQRLDAPDTYILPRRRPVPDQFLLSYEAFREAFPHEEYRDESNPTNWPVEETVLSTDFATGAEGRAQIPLSALQDWPSGVYRFTARSATDSTETTRHVVVFSSREQNLPYPEVDWFVPVKASGEPGEQAVFLVGSAAEDVHIRFDVEHEEEITGREWIRLSNEQRRIEIPIEEKHRGGFAVHVMFVRHNRAFVHTVVVEVPHSDKELEITLATFRDKVEPGSMETWKVRIGGPKGEKVASEMVAAMYDASLDPLRPHDWSFDILPRYYPQIGWNTNNLIHNASAFLHLPQPYARYEPRSYDRLNWFGFYSFGGRRRDIMFMKAANVDQVVVSEGRMGEMEAVQESAAVVPEAAPSPPAVGDGAAGTDPLLQVQARSNLGETAFFYPHLETNEEGEIVLSFTMPEALTRWRLLAFAHTKDLAYGKLTKEIVTQKELMVTPHAPRFFRESDSLQFTAKVANLTDTLLVGRARLLLFDALTMQPLDDALGNVHASRSFRVEGGGSASLSWTLNIPEGYSAVTYRVVAEAGGFSDGEEAVVPILPNRMLVTETLPLPVSGAGTKSFSLEKLISGGSPTMRHHALTLEFTPNPIWYAVQALPYLMESPHENAEHLFSRFYANSIASHIVRRNPRIERVFESWKGTDALVSNLQKNEDLKALLLDATPWVLEGRDETDRKQRIALLFEKNHMASELDRALRRLSQLQQGTGAWPWFEGMMPDRFVTQHIVAGFGHLEQLGVLVPMEDERVARMLVPAIQYLDEELRKDYDRLLERKADLSKQHIGHIQVHYLYARSFFGAVEVRPEVKRALDYYRGQARQYWLEFDPYLQGMIALGLHRYGDRETPQGIVRSLREHALHSEEMGMYWKRDAGFYWYQAPIETQALMIEVFHELTSDTAAIEAMKTWLLKQKQTQDWRTTKATAEAVYALLLRGTDLTAEDSEVVVQVGEEVVEPSSEEAGTGYFRETWSEVEPGMGRVTVRKEGDGTAWGALYWQYFETLDNITSAETPLQLEKQLYLHTITDTGPLLRPIGTEAMLAPGDRVTVRLVLRTDRDMEYVHLKDMRASGMEPINVLSGYRYQDGLGYYESTRDAATHFFFDRMPSGTYVFEYPLRVSHTGTFSGGIATIQSFYAPEFAAHSEGVRVRVDQERLERASLGSSAVK